MIFRDTFLVTLYVDFRVDFGSILRPKWTHFGPQKRSERESVCFRKPWFFIGGYAQNAMWSSPKHEKIKSESDARREYVFLMILDHFLSHFEVEK